MNVIMVGDVVGPAANAYLAGRIPQLRRSWGADLVIVSAAKYRGESYAHLPPYTLADGPIVLGAVWLRIED